MSRVTTKTELVIAANGQFDKLWKLIDSMSDALQNANFGSEMATAGKEAHWSRDKNVRDVLVHLYEWHQLVLNWVARNEKGAATPFLPTGITWANYQKMNVGFWEKHQNTPYDKSKQMVQDSHAQILALIDTYSEAELFGKFPFGLTAKSSIAEYCRAATASHYDWAIKKLKMYNKISNNPKK
jgi:hypothetical protein